MHFTDPVCLRILHVNWVFDALLDVGWTVRLPGVTGQPPPATAMAASNIQAGLMDLQGEKSTDGDEDAGGNEFARELHCLKSIVGRVGR